MRNINHKTVNDVIVSDPEEGMRKLAAATRHIISVPKAKPKVRAKRQSKK